ncbi:hypothetical protein [Mycoplasmopsis primatum]|uniref:hypothetical protein n=1 Tax=Mycoplasmopsis primatum TaxID=55604 RepID=UPI000497F8CB|nr:hypothetical protein [Mycoplasmopsis primatum]
MTKKIYRFNLWLYLACAVLAPILLCAPSIFLLIDYKNLEISFIDRVRGVPYITPSWAILCLGISGMIISIFLFYAVVYYFCYQLEFGAFTYKTIEIINIEKFQNKKIQMVKNKMLTKKNYQKWLVKNNFIYIEN